MTELHIDMDHVSNIIRKVSAEIILPKYKNLTDGDIREKNPGDFVTVADEMSEQALTQALQEYLPDSLVVGEEAVSADKNVLNRLKETAPVWVIDPIDGTFNFKSGRRHFGVLVALVQNNETLYAWGYDVLGERLITASKGRGAYITERDGQKTKLEFGSAPSMSDVTASGGGAHPWHFEFLNPHIKDAINLRCSLHDFIHLLTGEVQCIFHKYVTPWDHAAMILAVQEAGGHVAIVGADAEHDALYAPADVFGHCLLLNTMTRQSWDELAEVARPAVKKVSQDSVTN